jgi:hypothetical protein
MSESVEERSKEEEGMGTLQREKKIKIILIFEQNHVNEFSLL